MFGLVEVFPNAISSADIDKLISLAQHYKYEEATTTATQQYTTPYTERRTEVRGLPYYKSPVINQASTCIAKYLNGKSFPVTHIRNEIQLLRYSRRDERGDFFRKHTDQYDENQFRLVSTVVMLSASADYQGGDLILYNGKKEFYVPRDRGTVVCFPSTMYHEVTPVTDGVRYSMIIWSGRR